MTDLKRANLYVVNGIICDYKDFSGNYPTVADVRNNWQFDYLKIDITDEEISDVIQRVKKLDCAN